MTHTQKSLAILCVDDEVSILKSLKEQLTDHLENQYLIEIAESGEEALEVFQDLQEEGYEVALVISDCVMPKMSGDVLLCQLHEIAPNTLKIMLTGHSSTQAIANVVNQASLYRYLTKPWQCSDLILTVNEALKSYSKDRQLEEQHQLLEQQAVILREQNQKLLEMNQEKSEFLGIAAHDLKNPLSGIVSVVELMQEEICLSSLEETLKRTQLIKDASTQMFLLIRNLLDVNRIESEAMITELQRASLLPLVQQAIRHYELPAQHKNIQIILRYQQDDYFALCDEHFVAQILDNLVSNAVKYSPFNKQITIQVYQREQWVGFSVSDQGIGFTDEEKGQLFGKFKRLRAKPTGGEHSTGLGLFIVKKLVELMNGKIWCESKENHGAKFCVELPYIDCSYVDAACYYNVENNLQTI